MKKFLLPLIFIIALFSGCVKKDEECTRTDSTVVASVNERTDIRNYLTANNISATEHSSGFFYQLVTAGGGGTINNLCSQITVSYIGKLTNGNVFDSTATGQAISFALYQVIAGWQKGLPLIQKGGSINLFIPPSLGYGSQVIKDANNNVLIPANSILVFNIQLTNVINL